MPETITQEVIGSKLEEIEAERHVQVLYACESGSRAWGFPSRDSDYDVRFLYVQPLSRYLAVESRKETIDVMLHDGELDLGGWDVRKALRLLAKSNAALLEWLVSTVVYRREAAVRPLEEVAEAAFRPESVCHHYLALARRKAASMEEDGGPVRFKAYCYLVRSVLSAQYVADYVRRPPMDLASLLEASDSVAPLRGLVDELVRRKSSATEADRTPRVAELDDWIAATIESVSARVPKGSRRIPSDRLDQVFQEILRLAGVLP